MRNVIFDGYFITLAFKVTFSKQSYGESQSQQKITFGKQAIIIVIAEDHFEFEK